MRVYQCRGVAVLTLHMNECSTSKYCISTSQFKLQKAMRYQVSSLVINEFAKAFVSPLLRWYSSGDLSGMISWAALGHPVLPEPVKVGQNILTIPPHHHSCSRGPRKPSWLNKVPETEEEEDRKRRIAVQFLVEKSVKGARMEKMISNVAWLQVTASGWARNKKLGEVYWHLVHLQWEKKEGFQTFPHPAGSLLAPLLQSCQSFGIILVDFWLSKHAAFVCSSLMLPAKQAGLSKWFFQWVMSPRYPGKLWYQWNRKVLLPSTYNPMGDAKPNPPNCLLKSRGNWKSTFRSVGTGM